MFVYFAYGSNMLGAQMARRCPGARLIGHGFLDNWKYITTKRGTANIRRKTGHMVHGVLWQCDGRHIASLDRYEGVRWRNYLRRFLFIERPCGRGQNAVVYVGQRFLTGVARTDYMLNAVIPGARDNNLPASYIDELRSWLPRHYIGAAGRRYYGRKS